MSFLADIKLAPEGGFRGFGPLGLEGEDAANAGTIFNKFISSAVGIMSVIAFIWFVFLLFSGAYAIMSAGGDKERLENGRKKITSGITGIVVIVAALFIIDLIGFLIGIPDILNPGELIQKIGPGGN